MAGVGRFNVTVQGTGGPQPGPPLTVTVDAANLLEALDNARPVLVATLEASGLQVKPADVEPNPLRDQ